MSTDPTARGERGPAPSWNYGRTTTIRIPIALSDVVLNIAREIDKRGTENLIQIKELSKFITSEESQS